MSRPLVPSAVLAVLAMVGQVRPRFLDDSPSLDDARLVAQVPAAIRLRQAGSRSCSCQAAVMRIACVRLQG